MSSIKRKYDFLIMIIMILIIYICISTVFFFNCIDKKNSEISSLKKQVYMLDEHQASIVAEYFKMIGVGG